MCFTPAVSLTTALIEFLVAIFILFYYKKSSFSKIAVMLLFLLGAYQFSEFMVCVSGYPILWAKVGFIAYTLLPAAGLWFCLKNTGKKYNLFALFIAPILFSIFALVKPDFIMESTCGTYLVVIRHLFFDPAYYWASAFYLTYYFGFIFYIFYVYVLDFKKAKDDIDKKIDGDLMVGIAISLLPAIILLFIFPSLYLKFPSLYCQFALLFTIIILVAFHLDAKRTKKKEAKRRIKKEKKKRNKKKKKQKEKIMIIRTKRARKSRKKKSR